MPNLASRVLSLNMKRLSHDWQATYSHPIYIAETFVDPRFYGLFDLSRLEKMILEHVAGDFFRFPEEHD